MMREISVAFITAILVAFVTWLVVTSKEEFSRVQLKTIADEIKADDSFIDVLLAEFKNDPDFHGRDGQDGSPGIEEPIRKGDDYCSRVADSMQICWGTAELKGGGHYRSFDIQFAEAFSQPPTIVNGINAVSSGYSFAVYDHSISRSSYSGSMAETKDFRPSDTVVKFNYVAIGQR